MWLRGYCLELPAFVLPTEASHWVLLAPCLACRQALPRRGRRALRGLLRSLCQAALRAPLPAALPPRGLPQMRAARVAGGSIWGLAWPLGSNTEMQGFS
jgi:hypothetical protein